MNPGPQRDRLKDGLEFKLGQFEGRMENEENNFERISDFQEVLRKFAEFCLVNLQLSKQTVGQHIYNVRKFLAWIEKNGIDFPSVGDIRSFLLTLRDGNPYSYANMLKAL